MRRILALLLLVFTVQPLVADDGGAKSPALQRKLAQAAKEKGAKEKPLAVDATAEADVLEFVREHHPELADLLAQLKENHPKEYQKAVQDLSRVRQRLHVMQKNDDKRYALELSVWKAETRVQLLAARLQMSSSEELREQLRTALSEQIDLRLALLQHERDQAKERVSRLETQIKKLDSDRSQAIERQFKMLTSKTPAKKPEKAASAKPDAEKPAKPTKPKS